MSDNPLSEYHPRQWPVTVNPMTEDCPPWTRHASYLKEQEDIWVHAAVLSECDCNDCHLDRLCPYKFKYDEDSQKGCVKRLHDDLMRPIADGMTDHDKMIVTMMDAESSLRRLLAINKWLIGHASESFVNGQDYAYLQWECSALLDAIRCLNTRIRRAKDGKCQYDKTNFIGLE